MATGHVGPDPSGISPDDVSKKWLPAPSESESESNESCEWSEALQDLSEQSDGDLSENVEWFVQAANGRTPTIHIVEYFPLGGSAGAMLSRGLFRMAAGNGLGRMRHAGMRLRCMPILQESS